MFVAGVLFVVFAMKLRLRRSASTGGVLTALRAGNTLASNGCHGCHGEYDAVNAPFEREHHFAVHTEHHVCAQPARQGCQVVRPRCRIPAR